MEIASREDLGPQGHGRLRQVGGAPYAVSDMDTPRRSGSPATRTPCAVRFADIFRGNSGKPGRMAAAEAAVASYAADLS